MLDSMLREREHWDDPMKQLAAKKRVC